MKYHTDTSNWQTGLLVTLRFIIGWHLLYEGIYKLIHTGWSSTAFLAESTWIFKGVADWIIVNPGVLNGVDLLNTWGLIAIGLGLVLGLFTRAAGIAGFALLLLYYLFNPPFIGLGAGVTLEGNYLIVNKTLIEAVMLLLIAVSPTARILGLDMLLTNSSKQEEKQHRNRREDNIETVELKTSKQEY